MIRDLRRQKPLSRLRIWADGDWPFGAAPAGGVAVEWLGWIGNPTHYALVGGTLADRTVVRIPESSALFEDAITEGYGTVTMGVSSGIATGVDMASQFISTPLAIDIAASSSFGTSPLAVCFATAFLAHLLTTPELLEADDDSLWAASGESFRRCLKLSEQRRPSAPP